MADGKINRPYGGVLLLGIFLTPLLSLGHDYADGIITAKYFRFAEVVGIGLLLTWMVAWKRNFQFCFRWVDVGVVLFALYGVGTSGGSVKICQRPPFWHRFRWTDPDLSVR